MRHPTVDVAVLMLAVALLAPAPAVAVDELPPGGVFVDDDGNTHEGFIDAIGLAGITRGCDPPLNIHYCPTRTVTRAEMAAFLVRALELPAGADNAFTDDEGSIFEHDINALAAAGITKGCNPPDNTRYCPGDVVTRGQMAAFLTRAFDLAPTSVNAFVDDAGSIFEDDINALAAAGITKGCNPPDNTQYCPGNTVTRDQMASFLGRGLGLTPSVPWPRPEVIPGMAWSIELAASGDVDEMVGWTAAIGATGVAVATADSVEYFTPVFGRWEATTLERATPDAGEEFPRGVAASGNRVAVTASGHCPAVYIFEKVGAGWVDQRVPLPYDGGFDGGVAMDGDRVVVRWDPLQFVVLEWDGTEWSHRLYALDVDDPNAGQGPIAIEGDLIAFGDPWAQNAYAARWNGSTWEVSRLVHPWAGEWFGAAVDVDDGRILVGASGESPGPGGPAGLYMYTWNGTTWVGKVVAEGTSGFGSPARLSGDTILAEGASDEQGSFWVYEQVGGSWAGSEVDLAGAAMLGAIDLDGSLGIVTIPTTLTTTGHVIVFGVP